MPENEVEEEEIKVKVFHVNPVIHHNKKDIFTTSLVSLYTSHFSSAHHVFNV